MEAAGQASLRTVTYDNPEGAGSDKALVYSDSRRYRGSTDDFQEHFRRALTQLEVPRNDWEPLLRRYTAFNAAVSGVGAADPEDFFDIEYLGRYETIRYVLGLEGHGFVQGNLRVFLNTANGKFYPALGRDNLPSLLDLSGSRTPELQLNTWPRGVTIMRSRCSTSWPAATACDTRFTRAVYRFIVQDGMRLVRELEKGLVEGGALTPTDVAITRLAVRAGSETVVASAGSGVTFGREEARKILTSNIQSLRQYLERSAPAFSAQLSRGRIVLEIRPDSMSELSVKTTDGRRAGRHPDGGHPGHGARQQRGTGAAGDPRSASAVVNSSGQRLARCQPGACGCAVRDRSGQIDTAECARDQCALGARSG